MNLHIVFFQQIKKIVIENEFVLENYQNYA